MKEPFPKIRLVIISLLFIIWLAFGIYIVSEHKYTPFLVFLSKYEPAFFYFIASVLLFCRKRWIDLISLIIFLASPILLVSSSINYCKEQELFTMALCSESVFSILYNQDLLDNSIRMVSTITALYLAIILILSLFKKKDLEFR